MTEIPPTLATPSPAPKRLAEPEFIALVAMLAATVAFSIDAMLPALPKIGEELSPDFVNRAQLILTSFVLGMGAGTLFTGPLSDRFGRKPVLLGGVALYVAGALLAWAAPTLELMLAARVIQGLGAAGPRVVSMALIRDLYSGRQMARTMSFVMMVFTLVPALAPTMGYVVISAFGWRSIFGAFILFAVIAAIWLGLRQPETLLPERRRTLSPRDLAHAVREVWAHPTSRLSTLVQTLVFGMLFGMLSSTQQIFDETYGRGDTFHLWFGGIAVLAASSNVVNARLVVRLGMRAMVKGMFTAQMILSLIMVAVLLFHLPPTLEFALFLIWTTSLFFQAGMCIGNLNALALEPMGHIAGLAASVVTATATVGAVMLAVPVGLLFNGTAIPLAGGTFLMSTTALLITMQIRRDSDPD
ncbi:multidrug effflux MFS transporter [Roseisalinus antarcticus]|uniref:Bicyclomycin resistance protein n=1 Tax=Roseisalinus antarcticus TaxID=254357 RepID=A0A1Y5TBW8_9RHOB|nr:multidrug effflux MFS transporter [Roseisalinus antarcticus]SLN60271.1 Bicyclomycin resistance protein [Roseisalinus antarcticus]